MPLSGITMKQMKKTIQEDHQGCLHHLTEAEHRLPDVGLAPPIAAGIHQIGGTSPRCYCRCGNGIAAYCYCG